MKLPSNTYRAHNKKTYEIFTQFSRPVPDIECRLYRFQIYVDEETFACDTFISYSLIEKYQLSDKRAEEFCYQKLCRALDANLNEYCSIIVGRGDVEPFI